MHSCNDHHQDNYLQEQDMKIRDSLSQIKRKIVVMSGKGGVGKSTVAVNLAAALAMEGHTVGLLDVDLHGPSVPTMLGIKDERLVSGFDSILPFIITDNLKVLSIANLMGGPDDAVIWRGPMKIGAIRQFISDVEWGPLDFLVIDSPPGTGDEPLTVAQTVTDGQAVIVTTPQEVAMADVRRCVNFCRKVSMPIAGLIENMSGLICPHCNEEIALFKKGGGEAGALEMGIAFLGSIPLDPSVVQSGDSGKPFMHSHQQSPCCRAFQKIVAGIISSEEDMTSRPREKAGTCCGSSTPCGNRKQCCGK